MRRRGEFILRISVITRGGAEGEAEPELKDKGQLLRLGESHWPATENIELGALELFQQPPIDRSHKLGGGHGFAVLGGQGALSGGIKLFCAVSHAFGEGAVIV